MTTLLLPLCDSCATQQSLEAEAIQVHESLHAMAELLLPTMHSLHEASPLNPAERMSLHMSLSVRKDLMTISRGCPFTIYPCVFLPSNPSS